MFSNFWYCKNKLKLCRYMDFNYTQDKFKLYVTLVNFSNLKDMLLYTDIYAFFLMLRKATKIITKTLIVTLPSDQNYMNT